MQIRLLPATICSAAAIALAMSSTPASAQFRGLFDRGKRGAEKAENCEEGKKGDIGRGILGGIVGGAINDLARGSGVTHYVPVPEFTDQLTTEIACKLTPEEQEQAANATLEATRSASAGATPDIGSSASWQSTSRDNVSGTSTVTGREKASGNADCITVTDVIIVEGEETRANKRMCRPPGSARYAIVA